MTGAMDGMAGTRQKERIACLWMQPLSGWGNGEEMRLDFSFQGLWALAEAQFTSWTHAFTYPNIIMEHLFRARCLDACNKIMNK